MSAITRNPTNKDILQSTKFKLNFARIPATTYFCQSASLPGLSLTEVPRNTPFIDLYVPGEKLLYDTLNITFLVDEDLVGWQEIHDWIRAMTFPYDFEEYVNLKNLSSVAQSRSINRLPPQYSDASMTIYTNKNNPNIRVQFKDLFPISLGGLVFNSSDSAENIITSDVTFRFSYYNIERL
jgi:hypothetical protein